MKTSNPGLSNRNQSQKKGTTLHNDICRRPQTLSLYKNEDSIHLLNEIHLFIT